MDTIATKYVFIKLPFFISLARFLRKERGYNRYLPEIFFLWFILCICSCCVSEKRVAGHDGAIDVDSLIEQYRDSVLSDPVAVIDYFNTITEKVTDSIHSNMLLLTIASSYCYLNRVDTAMILFDRILDFCNREANVASHNTRTIGRINVLKASVYNCRGTIFQESGLPDSALINFEKSYSLHPTVSVCINIAESYSFKGNLPLASRYLRSALLTADSLQEGEKYNFIIFSSMARLYHDLDNFTLAEHYYEKAAQYGEYIDVLDKIFFENTRGNFYYLTKDYEKATVCFQHADRLAETISQPRLQAIARTNMGEIFLLQENPDSARFYIDCAKELLGPLFFTPQFNFYLTGLYAALALKEDNLREAEKLLMQPYDTLSVNPQYVYFHNRRLADYYLRKQDYQKAYYYRSEAEAYNDSIRNVKILNNIAEIDARYRQDTILLKKDIHIAKVENSAIQWKYTTITSIALFTVVLLASMGIILYRMKINELRHVKQHSTIVALRMEIIRNRLSPHFMFNALHVVMPSFRKYKELENPFRKLIQLLRDNLIASEQVAVPLQQEIERVQNYLHFQALKQTLTIRTEWLVMPEVSTETLIPSMSIQIPVENAIKYAFLPDHADACLQVMAKPENDAISVTIEDNGTGYNPNAQPDTQKGTGSGLTMLRRTIELLNANNINKIIFKIENRETDVPPGQGTRVYMFIPTHYKYDW